MRRMFSRQSASERIEESAPSSSRKMMLVALSALGALAFLWYRDWSQGRAEPSLGKEVEKWEGEGGNVPEVPTVHPAPLEVPPTLH